MASITEEDLGDVKILIIPEVSEFREGEDPAQFDKELQAKIAEFLHALPPSEGAQKPKPKSKKRKTGAVEKKSEPEFYCDSVKEEDSESVNSDTARGVKEDSSESVSSKTVRKGAAIGPVRKHPCKFCRKSFNHKSTLSRHKLLIHSANPPSFTCAHCKKIYKTKVSLRRHLQSVISNNTPRKIGLNVNCALCDHQCGKSEMIVHYEDEHDQVIEKDIIRFDSEKAFFEWKHQTEIETTARFTKIRKDRVIKDGTKESFYRCHRDGVYKPRGNNLRNLKKLGSNKINGHCPAKMQVWINQDHEVSVMFVKTHVGHSMEISRLTLTKEERDHIAQQLAMQVPFDTILEACRESAVGAENIRRMNLLTRKDLYNIESSYSLSKVTYRNCLGANVEHWVKDMIGQHCESFIKFYKPQGKLVEDFPDLHSEDFLLVLMNEAQVDIMKTGGNDHLCVDLTSIASDFSLVTVLVLDEREQGFPVAFMITNNTQNHALELFFTALKEATSIIFKPRIFVSGLDDTFAKSWNVVMAPASFRIYSPWIVDEEWRSNLDKITNPEKQVYYYNKLVAIMEETNVQTFEEELDSTYRDMKNDKEAQEFAQFFETYKSKASSWAHCFRNHLGVNVNEQLERIQASLKTVYECKLKKVMQLERFIFSLMGSVKEHLFDSLISFNSGFLERMKSDYQHRHSLAEEIPKSSLMKKPKQWHVTTDKVYKVKVISPECGCAHSCPDCQACMHSYICSCVESSLKWTVCEHVHAVCMKMKTGTIFAYKPDVDVTSDVQAFTVDGIDDPDQTNLIINVPESAYQYMTVPADGDDGNVLLTFETDDMDDNGELILGYAEEDPDVKVEERRSLLAQKCQNILNRISSEAQVAAFEQAMANLETDVTFID